MDADSFLVLGDGGPYSMDLNASRPVETCCAFFRSGFVEAIAHDATTPLQASLDDPERPVPALPFLSRLHSDANGSIVGHLQTLAMRCSAQLQPSGFEEDFLLLANNLLVFCGTVSRQISRLPAVKTSTREELFRRVEIGEEYLHSHTDGPVSLEEVSKAACLSRYHFHRAFKRAFGETPHAYLTNVRLRRARSLLRTGVPVIQACMEVGFSSASSFSRLFRAHFGVSPSGARKE